MFSLIFRLFSIEYLDKSETMTTKMDDDLQLNGNASFVGSSGNMLKLCSISLLYSIHFISLRIYVLICLKYIVQSKNVFKISVRSMEDLSTMMGTI